MKNKVSIVILFLILFGLYFFIPRNIKIYEKILIPTDRDCFGQFWLIIANENQAKHIEEKYKKAARAVDATPKSHSLKEFYGS
mgnify:CR=1 FL=1